MRNERSIYAALLSGGKDSNFAMFEIYRRTGQLPCCAITVFTEKDDMVFHYENTSWVKLQCASLGIPWIAVKSIEEGLDAASRNYDAKELVTGGIASNFQKRKFSEVAAKFNMKTVNPLWGIDQEYYMRQLPGNGFDYIIVKVASLGLGREWLGRKMDGDATEQLIKLSKRYRFNPSLEGGEGETFVLWMPLYRKRIRINDAEMVWEKDSGTYLIRSADLE
ncbi:MAG: diphthine--ammonia ligase [Nitrososphaerota archaeon]|nr:diphthine--ammonia ligase [Nitrososphaerota archaeon]MDG6927706.1 diphthine--ammonia ligase [Nitrososphaerota archaeon]MDG6930173.1 diphthine--ammonia ligase [Nitrososphaerota archaeon]MDG6932046.1 diphthine--ammonia ligase [Nitrososphaerota archaeon]MDG6935421.1 diphthine--ammonia ligase [Nitrososphaerota archaeon]